MSSILSWKSIAGVMLSSAVNVSLNVVAPSHHTAIQLLQGRYLETPPHVLDQVIGFGVHNCRSHCLCCIVQHRLVVWVQLQCHTWCPFACLNVAIRFSITAQLILLRLWCKPAVDLDRLAVVPPARRDARLSQCVLIFFLPFFFFSSSFFLVDSEQCRPLNGKLRTIAQGLEPVGSSLAAPYAVQVRCFPPGFAFVIPLSPPTHTLAPTAPPASFSARTYHSAPNRRLSEKPSGTSGWQMGMMLGSNGVQRTGR